MQFIRQLIVRQFSIDLELPGPQTTSGTALAPGGSYLPYVVTAETAKPTKAIATNGSAS